MWFLHWVFSWRLWIRKKNTCHDKLILQFFNDVCIKPILLDCYWFPLKFTEGHLNILLFCANRILFTFVLICKFMCSVQFRTFVELELNGLLWKDIWIFQVMSLHCNCVKMRKVLFLIEMTSRNFSDVGNICFACVSFFSSCKSTQSGTYFLNETNGKTK